MTEAVHKAGGMIVMQLAHAGLRPSSSAQMIGAAERGFAPPL
jgi:2,4-dienoyl-CoA reductase-like NADH-dependent reductase (Old Yellow Enzyme family)